VVLGSVPNRSRAECDPAKLGLAPALKETPVNGEGQAAETAFRHLFRAVTFQIGQLRREVEWGYGEDTLEASVLRARLKVWKRVLLLVGDSYYWFQVEANCGEAARPSVQEPLHGYLEEDLPPERVRDDDPDIEFF